MDDIRVGDTGTIFDINIIEDEVSVDISNATETLIYFKKPSRTTVQKTAVFSTDGTDGHLRYTTVDANDLDEAGQWKIQAKVTTPEGSWRSSIGEFYVNNNL